VPRSQADLVQGFFTEVLYKRLEFAPEPSVETAGDETFHSMCAGSNYWVIASPSHPYLSGVIASPI
jgi:hypothetical protein